MDDLAWQRMSKSFPALLQGARIDPSPLAAATEKQPPFICGAFSPDETRIALSGGGRIPGRPAIWVARLPTFETELTLRGHQGVHALAWHAETGLLASASNDYTSVLWDVVRRDHLFVTGGDEPIVKSALAFAKRALYVGEGEAFRGLEARLLRVSLDDGAIATVRRLGQSPQMAVSMLAVDAETERWATVEDDFHYDQERRAVLGTGASGPGSPNKLDVRVLAMRWRAGELAVVVRDAAGVEVRVGAASRRIDVKETDACAISTDGRAIAVAKERRVSAIAVDDGRVLWSSELTAPSDYRTTLLEWSPSGAFLCAAGFGRLSLLDARTGKVMTSITPPAWFASGR